MHQTRLELAPRAREHGEVSNRELQVLHRLAMGDTAVAIGHNLQISPATVRKHLQNVYRKLGTGDRLQAVSIAYREGLIATR